MRNRLLHAAALAATLTVATIGLSACVTDGYDPYPQYGHDGYYDRGYYDRGYDRRWDDRRWDDRRWDGRRGDDHRGNAFQQWRDSVR